MLNKAKDRSLLKMGFIPSTGHRPGPGGPGGGSDQGMDGGGANQPGLCAGAQKLGAGAGPAAGRRAGKLMPAGLQT